MQSNIFKLHFLFANYSVIQYLAKLKPTMNNIVIFLGRYNEVLYIINVPICATYLNIALVHKYSGTKCYSIRASPCSGGLAKGQSRLLSGLTAVMYAISEAYGQLDRYVIAYSSYKIPELVHNLINRNILPLLLLRILKYYR